MEGVKQQWNTTTLDQLCACVTDLLPHFKGAIGLSGELGAGKTEFVRTVAKLVGCEDQVTSPSFVLQNIYSGVDSTGAVITIEHWDLYRLKGKSAPEELKNYQVEKGKLTFIEWPENCPEITAILTARVSIQHQESGSRLLTFTALTHR